MPRIRAFVAHDIPAVADLHARVFETPPGAAPATRAFYDDYLRDVFLDGRPRQRGIDSLVCEFKGRIVGFLGVMAAPLRFGTRRLWTSLCTQFCVEPAHRGLIGLKMVRHHFDGPQDLAITDEANDATRQVWEWAGGETVIPSSLYWTRVLRPGRFGLSLLDGRRSLAMAAALTRPVAHLGDALLGHVPHAYFRPCSTAVSEPLTMAHVIEHLPVVARRRAIVPIYSPELSAWHFRQAQRHARGVPPRQVLVRDGDGTVLGWYIYVVEPGRTATVLQLAASAETTSRVLDHLFHDAWTRGLTAITGRVDPLAIQAYSDRYCVFNRRGPWMMIRTADAEVSTACHRGQLFFSRLDGEWCARLG